MGSTGSGHFSDYSGIRNTSERTGGSSGTDRCALAFSTNLDEVGASQFYMENSNVPVVGTKVRLIFDVRLAIVNEDGNIIGYLPTQFNYLKLCIDSGFEYSGLVSTSSIIGIPSVRVDIQPNV